MVSFRFLMIFFSMVYAQIIRGIEWSFQSMSAVELVKMFVILVSHLCACHAFSDILIF